MPTQSTLTESNNSWLNANVEKIGDYANKSELINDFNENQYDSYLININLSKKTAEKMGTT
ncbi:hypothetical protein [Brumicola nitratireducens]|nr:hypothetical protein [Glaciecola nitratireducens]